MDPETWATSKIWRVVHVNTGLALDSITWKWKGLTSRRAAIAFLRRAVEVWPHWNDIKIADASDKASSALRKEACSALTAAKIGGWE